MNPILWPALEAIPELCADATTWKAALGADFQAFSRFLKAEPGASVWWLDLPKFRRALGQAVALAPKTAEFPLAATGQIGSWSANAVPAILTIQSEPREFRLVVAELVARLRRPFILLAPTNQHLTAVCQELLANGGAEFYSLESSVTLTAEGNLLPARPPVEIFAKFAPQPQEPVPEEVARRAFALVRALDSGELAGRHRSPLKAPLYTVFRLYCSEGLNVGQIARRCRCTRSLIFARLRTLRKQLGRNPSEFRQYSRHFEEIDRSLSDPRARRIHRKQAIYADECDADIGGY